MALVQRAESVNGGLSISLSKLLQATNSAQVEEVIQLLEKEGGEWRLVGDRNNYATVQMPSLPGAALIERVTNAIDASLELAAQSNKQLTLNCQSPREFVEKAFGVKGG